ncbi:MAG: DUF3048 domain-containing protein [bacterium]|jgi:hypothetical protein|nr:DUF3048 domain-containing protein [bacterium]
MTKKIENNAFGEVIEKLRQMDRLTLIGLSVVVLLLALVVLLAPKMFVDEVTEEYAEEEIEAPGGVPHPLTGELQKQSPSELPRVVAVMIDNHFDAWPPSGLDQAFLVVEAPVEGGITRMIAFFHEDQKVEEIGPVRSARPYYLDWANELDALYVHVGGSPEALDLIASGSTFDMNQFWWGDYFWRAADRFAPHNVMTTSENLFEFSIARDELGHAPERLYGSWDFKDREILASAVTELELAFAEPVYVIGWSFDEEAGSYLRDQYYQPHATSDGEQIAAQNVVVIETDVEVIDSVGRRSLRTTGVGDGYVFQDGQQIEVRWEKPSASERLRFYHIDSDDEVVMNAGITWIEVLPSLDDLRVE